MGFQSLFEHDFSGKLLHSFPDHALGKPRHQNGEVESEGNRMKRTIVVAGALVIGVVAGVGAVMAQQDQVKDTQTMMKGNGRNAGALAAMIKGEKPYDQATVDAALTQFADTAAKLPTLFPESIKVSRSTATTAPRPRSGTTRRVLPITSRASPRPWATPRARSRM